MTRPALATIAALAIVAAYALGRGDGRASTLAETQARLAQRWGAQASAMLAGMDAPNPSKSSNSSPAVETAPVPMGEPSRWRCQDVPPSVAPASVSRWCAEIDAAADRWGMDPRALTVLVSVECPQGDPACGSHAGARGLAQIMAPTAVTIAAETGLPCTDGPNGVNLDPSVNLTCGAHYYAKALKAAATIWRAGDEASHVGAAGIGYNAGVGRVPDAVAHWQAGGHVCEAPVPAESQRWCRMAYDAWTVMTASPAPLDGALGIAWRGRP